MLVSSHGISDYYKQEIFLKNMPAIVIQITKDMLPIPRIPWPLFFPVFIAILVHDQDLLMSSVDVAIHDKHALRHYYFSLIRYFVPILISSFIVWLRLL